MQRFLSSRLAQTLSAPIRRQLVRHTQRVARAEVRQATTGIEAVAADLERARRALAADLAEAQRQLSDTRDRLAQVEATEHTTVTRVDVVERSLAQHVEVHLHRASVLSRAFERSTQQMPPKIVLLMTIERSGSTALFDLLRSHPTGYVEPLWFIWERLGLKGRRYPTSMSDPRGMYSVPIEVEKGLGALIPALDGEIDRSPQHGYFAVEKAHPQFLAHDVDALEVAIRELEAAGTGVQVVIQVRRPLDVMWSMAEYKRRVPTWYEGTPVETIPAYVRSSFEALDGVARRLDAVTVLDNEDVATVSDALLSFWQQLDPAHADDASRHQLLERLSRITGRQQTTSFVGERDPERSADGPDGLWRGAADECRAADRVWRRMTRSSVVG